MNDALTPANPPPGSPASDRIPRVPRWRGAGLAAAIALAAAGCTARSAAPSPTATLRERVAALALRQSDFGAVSLLPVRFAQSRIAGPFEDDGRRLYCVSSRMKGRSFGRGERPRVVIRDDGGTLKVLDDEEDVCTGHHTEPFPELETLAAARG